MKRYGMLSASLMMLLVHTGCHGARQSRPCDPSATVDGTPVIETRGKSQHDLHRQPEQVVTRRITGDDVERMEDLYNECRYEECLMAAEELVSQTAAKSNYRAAAWFYKGVFLVLKEQENQARECFQQARRLDDDLKADKRRFKPAVVKCFQSSTP